MEKARTTGAVSADKGDAIDVTDTSGYGGARLSATVILLRDDADGMTVSSGKAEALSRSLASWG